MPVQDVQEYFVVGKKQETPTITTLSLTLLNGHVPSFKAGQYIMVYFPDSKVQRGKEYSISSAPIEDTFTITVRAVGEYSNRLCAMNCGTTFMGSLPRGSFYREHNDTDLVLLAAGIGVTPFRSIIFDVAARTSSQKLHLFYSNTTSQENLFMRDFDRLAKRNKNFRVQSYITRESLTTPVALVRRINPENILRTVHNSVRSEFLISGATSFVREQRIGLENAGFLHERIYTEVCS